MECRLITAHSDAAARIREFIIKDADAGIDPVPGQPDPFWAGLRAAGTEPWLDTGDLDAASKLWSSEFSALTTNNTLLNAEVQKGIYDALIREAAAHLADLDPQTQVMEIAFALNARHGLRLAHRFGGKVSVELHTDTAHDVEAAVAYGQRFYAICPDHFIVKVPLTPAGLIATRELGARNIPVNFTLGFSARQNCVAAVFARPAYVNVFLGRLNAYVADNGLGSGDLVGEKATLASQRCVTDASRGRQQPTRQIAASMRAADNLAALAGVDVHTIPVKVAAAAKTELDGKWSSRRDCDYDVALAPGIDPDGCRLHALWGVPEPVWAFAASIEARPPASGNELAERARAAGVGDLFPLLSEADQARIAGDGKIPKHTVWQERIQAGELAIDTLLNLAGLASFAADQAALDTRIRRLIS